MKKTIPLILLSMALAISTSSSAIVFTETFTYPDGPLVGATGSPWVTHSGSTPGEVNVASGSAVVTQAETEDVSAPMSPVGTFYNAGILTLTMTATFTTLPGSANYFSHFKDNTTTGFRGRIFATTTGAAVGSYRLGIANGTSTAAFVPTDLSLNSPVGISMAWNITTGVASLSVNGGTIVTATDAAAPLSIYTVALRQSNTIGVMNIDNMTVDATALPVPEASTSLLLGLLGGLGLVRRRR